MTSPIPPIPDSRILLTGTHLGYHWLVCHNGIGFRSGFIRVPPNHPWAGVPAEKVPARAHGRGLSHQGHDLTPKDEFNDRIIVDSDSLGWWLGFTCTRFDDAVDPALPNEIKGAIGRYYAGMNCHGRVRSTAYVRTQCIILCDQAADAAARLAVSRKPHRRGGRKPLVGRHYVTPWLSENLLLPKAFVRSLEKVPATEASP